MKLKQIRVDGYKNLINCVLNLGDFNVLVGPNNSGKSNFFEVFTILFGVCFGSEKLRKGVFEGFPARRFGSSICHLKGYENKPLAIGITFEVNIGKETWVVDYDLAVKRSWQNNEEEAQFLSEILQAKQPFKTGKAKIYISRSRNNLKVRGKKERNIAKNNSSLLAIKSIYPEFEGLPYEMRSFLYGIREAALTCVLAISPDGLRKTIGEETRIGGFRVSSFDLLLAMDEIYDNKKDYEIFRQTLCDILDLDDVQFVRKDIPMPSKSNKEKKTLDRVRFCLIKRPGDRAANIYEYSDGTLVVAAILTAIFSKTFIGPMLCLEELENCLHPAEVKKMLRFLQDHSDRRPVLITTQSPYILNGVNPEDVHVAVVNKTGATHFEKVHNTKQLREYLNKGLMSFGDLLAKDFDGFREG